MALAGLALLGALIAGLALSGALGGAGRSRGTVGGAVGLSASGASRASRQRRVGARGPLPVSVSIDARDPGAPIPTDFLGLSFELSALGQIADYAGQGDLVTLLRSLGTGVMRFGGVSADTRVAWTDAATPLPGWASAALEAHELRALGKLAKESGWHVVITIGLAHFDPRAAAREAAAAQAALGRWLTGIELGNEPDAYARHGLRPAPWGFPSYERQIAIYRRAIAKVAPGVRLLGPDVSGSLVFESWGPATATTERPALLTGHHYPLGCHDVPAPSIARLLAPQVRRGEDASLRRYLAVSRAEAVGFRLDETNTVSCGGRAGVSDTFAAALWAVDYVTRTMAAGAAGVNLQSAPANCRGYSPLCAPSPATLAAGALSVQPEWYALLLTSTLTGARPVASTVRPGRPNLDVHALLDDRDRLHVVIVDDEPSGAGPTVIALHLPRGAHAAEVLRLTAPSAAAQSGVTLGGRAVAGDGAWRWPPGLRLSADTAGVLTLTVSPASAALVTAALPAASLAR